MDIYMIHCSKIKLDNLSYCSIAAAVEQCTASNSDIIIVQKYIRVVVWGEGESELLEKCTHRAAFHSEGNKPDE